MLIVTEYAALKFCSDKTSFSGNIMFMVLSEMFLLSTHYTKYGLVER